MQQWRSRRAPRTSLVKSLGADVVVDYKTDAFEDVLSGYDLVLDSLGPDSVAKSLTVLKPGGIVIGLGGPPDPTFSRSIGANPIMQLATGLISRKVRKTARRLDVRYSFLFMRASGEQLEILARLVDDGVIRPVVDSVFAFDQTLEALAHVDSGRAKGKVVVTMR
ncbi:zinc-binding dehydrogenase [Aeromicrobium sp. UC242_57]|uniref:zinc-binding dehydrogenase n=1 Tax=Aeromicrobium sp. UC242_57 TaxID=3374624 RepID=UPI0037B03A11